MLRELSIYRLTPVVFRMYNKLKEFESIGHIKAAEQKEIYNAIRSKISLLNGYFENLESKVRYTFGKEGNS